MKIIIKGRRGGVGRVGSEFKGLVLKGISYFLGIESVIRRVRDSWRCRGGLSGIGRRWRDLEIMDLCGGRLLES